MITIDGSQGEGGGQILRTSLALSLITGEPFRMDLIRAGRKKPGLLHQHLTAVEAAETIGSAEVIGAELGSQSLQFRPNAVKPGVYHFAVGTAGSATLVLQTVLPPLLIAAGPSVLTLEGGTHNPAAPPFNFLKRCFVPLLEQMGARIELNLDRPGFYPAGGGKFRAHIEPVKQLNTLELMERGEIQDRAARAIVSKLPSQIGERELAVVRELLGWNEDELHLECIDNSPGPGNALLLEIRSENLTEVFTGFAERGRRAEDVAREATRAADVWMSANVPVDEHLADQLLLPMALAKGGSFRTVKPSSHSITNAGIIERFLPVKFEFVEESAVAWRVSVETR